MRLLRRAAIKAASLTRLARSAPEKPGVPRAMVFRFTSGASGTFAHVHLQDVLAADHVRVRHHHLAVETAGAQQRRIEHVGPVGGGDQDDAFIGLEAVHLDQQLIERLLALVIAAAEAGAAMAADRVDFVDEDDAGRVLLGLLEHVAHARGADADEHLDEVGAGNGEERHVGFAGDRARDQRLAGARRADQQHAARNASAQALEFSGIAQEFDDLLQILLGLVDAGDVLEGDAAMRLGQKFRARLAEAERLAARALHLPRQENPHADQRDERQPRDQQRDEPRHVVLLRARGDRHALGVELLHQAGIVRRVGLEAGAVGEGAVNFRPLDHARRARGPGRPRSAVARTRCPATVVRCPGFWNSVNSASSNRTMITQRAKLRRLAFIRRPYRRVGRCGHRLMAEFRGDFTSIPVHNVGTVGRMGKGPNLMYSSAILLALALPRPACG